MTNPSIQKPFEKAFRKKRISAFLTTSIALFCLFCFLTSTSIKEFTTITNLQITSDSTNTQSIVRSAVDEQTSDQQLSTYVTAAANNADIVANADIATHNLPVIRDSLDIQLSGSKQDQHYILSIQYRGKGTDCEKYLTKRFAQDLARRLDSRLRSGQMRDQVGDLIASVEDRIRNASDIYYSDLESAETRVSQINAELSNVHRAIQGMKQLASSNGSSAASIDSQQIMASVTTLDQIVVAIKQLGQTDQKINMENIDLAFADMRKMLVSLQKNAETSNSQDKGPMRVVNTSLQSRNTGTGPILDSLEQIDTDTLQSDLYSLRESVRDNAVNLREQFVNLKLANGSMPSGNLTVDSIAQLKTAPIQSAPGLPHLLLFGLISCFLGACIAMAYKPALDGVGFQTVDQAGQSLGIPVIATLSQKTANAGQETESKRTGLANTFVRISEVVLFAFLLLIILLCLVQPEIREAMFANPFYGLSKISSLFFG